MKLLLYLSLLIITQINRFYRFYYKYSLTKAMRIIYDNIFVLQNTKIIFNRIKFNEISYVSNNMILLSSILSMIFLTCLISKIKYYSKISFNINQPYVFRNNN